MSKLLEVFGRAITVNPADLIWHWLNAVKIKTRPDHDLQYDYFEEIIELIGNLQLDKAQEKLNFHLFENPDCLQGRMAAAAICLHKNQVSEAIEQLQSIYLRQPSNTMALYGLGYCYERTEHESEAVEFYQDCLKFKSHLQLPRQRLAAIYFKNGRLDKAIEQYELLIKEHPGDISSLVLLGYLYIVDCRCERAIDMFNMAIISHPDNFQNDGASYEIEELVGAGQFDEAVEHIQELLKNIGEHPDLYVKMGDIFSQSGRGAEAIANYESAIRVQPNYLEATIKLGTHYLRNHQLALAAENFNRAIEINDEIVDAYVGLSIAQQLAAEPQEALRTLSLASVIQQNSTLLFSETAKLNAQITLRGRPTEDVATESSSVLIDDVIEAHKSQMASTPRSADAHYKFGILMMLTGKLSEAVKSFENAVAINPTHHRARCKMALCLYETGMGEQSMGLLTKHAEALDAATLALHYQTAVLYCDKEKFALALGNLEDKMKNNFSADDAAGNIEVVLENLGLIDRAYTTWARLTLTAHNLSGENF